MKKIIFIGILLVIVAKGYGQEIDGVRISSMKGEYITVTGYKASTKVFVDTGYSTRTGKARITENGKPVEFISQIAAVNYICKQGYEVINASNFFLTASIGTVYLLKRTN